MAKYSLSEIDSLTKKATRGAGYSWGIAEEVGKSLRWLSAYGFLGAEVLSQHLLNVNNHRQSIKPRLISATAKDKVFGSDNGEICSLICGALLNDLGHQIDENNEIIFQNMSYPILALPAAGKIAEAFNISVSYCIADAKIICNPNGIVLKDIPPLFRTFFLNEKADVICEIVKNDSANTHFPNPKSRFISKEVLKTLEKFAHTTYAPATEESRLRGAG